ncbi:MAG: cytochrome b, partial [Pseudohongiellaceae bacterium]
FSVVHLYRAAKCLCSAHPLRCLRIVKEFGLGLSYKSDSIGGDFLMRRYHPILVTLHWLMALLVILTLTFGKLLADLPYDNPDKVLVLGVHMGYGMGIGLLLLIRLVTRLRSEHPPRATTGNNLLDRIGAWTHWGFYLLIAAMVLTGLASAFGADLFSIIYGGAATTIPPELAAFPQRLAHGIFSTLLIVLIALHFAAALYHQFVLGDGLLKRMWFGKRL